MSPVVTEDHRAALEADGFSRLERFAAPEVGEAMLADVVGLARAADGTMLA